MDGKRENMDLKVSKQGLNEHRKLMLKSFLHNKLAIGGLIITVLLLLLSILSPVIAPVGPYEMDVVNKLKPPSAAHIFGTDNLGRDVFARTVYGIKLSLFVGAATACVTFILGLLLGLLAGYFKFWDNVIMRVCESMMSIPSILMAIALMAALGSSVGNIIIALSIVYTPMVARVARSAVLSVKEQTYIEAIASQGASWPRILFGHIAPNVISPVIVQSTFTFASAIIVEASLSYLGCGIPSVIPTLGNIINDAKLVVLTSWWMTLFPSIVMLLLVLGVNILGDGVRDVLDPLSN